MEYKPRRVEGEPPEVRRRWLRQAVDLVRRKPSSFVLGCVVYIGAIELIDRHGAASFTDPWGMVTWLAMLLAIIASAPWFMAAMIALAHAADHSGNVFAAWRGLLAPATRRRLGEIALRTMVIFGGIICIAQAVLIGVVEALPAPEGTDAAQRAAESVWEPAHPIAWLLIALAEHAWYAVLASPLAIAIGELFVLPVVLRTDSDRASARTLSIQAVALNLRAVQAFYLGLPLMLIAALMPGVMMVFLFGFACCVIYVAYRDIFEARAENAPEPARDFAAAPVQG